MKATPNQMIEQPLLLIQRLPNYPTDLPLPCYQSDGAAGIDLVAAERCDIAPEGWLSVATGVSVAIPVGYVGAVRSRSGLAFGPFVTAFHGTIDSDYRGETGR